MNEIDLSNIEQRLGLVLPNAYRQALSMGVRINGCRPEPYFRQDATDLLIRNLELRMCPRPDAFANSNWPERLLCIGDDECGNYYGIFTDDERCAIQFFDHEADTFEAIHASLPQFLDSLQERHFNPPSQASSPSDAPAEMSSSAACVARTVRVRESVLAPISLDEWLAYVAADAELELRGYHEMTNPFDDREVLHVNYRGLAVLVDHPKSQEFLWCCGRIEIRRPGLAALKKLDDIARTLHARVLVGW